MSPDGTEGRVRLEHQGAIATLVFDRPAARNAMTWAMYEQLGAHCRALDAAIRAGGTRVVVLRGEGGEAFVAGTDITQFQDFRAGPRDGGDDGVGYEQGIDAGVDLVERLPCPTLAVVQGWAVGGGLALASACDFRLATPGARFGVPIARTLGNTLSMANLARLRQAWGAQPLRRMLLLAELLDADEALALGFLHQLVAPDALEHAITALATRLAALAPVTQRAAKEGLRRLAQAAVPDGEDLIRACYGSSDFREGVAAFVGKRAPVWRGE